MTPTPEPSATGGNGAVRLEVPTIEAPEIRPGAYAWTVRGPDGDEHITSDAKDTAAFFAAHVKGKDAIVTPDAIVILGHGTVAVRPGWSDAEEEDEDEEEDDDRGNRAPRGSAGTTW